MIALLKAATAASGCANTENTVEEAWLVLQTFTLKGNHFNKQQGTNPETLEKPDVWVVAHENVDSIQKNRRALYPCNPDTLLIYYLQFHTRVKAISNPDEQLTATPIQKNIFFKDLVHSPI